MVTRVQKWGNSQGLRLSKQLLSELDVAVGDEVVLSVREGVLVMTPARRVRGRHDLAELVNRIPEDARPAEVEWGAPVGREVW